MIKKLCILLLIACLMPFGSLINADINEINVASGVSKLDTFNLSHAVTRISSFQTITKTSKIDEGNKNIDIGTLKVKNNTRDGFTLTVESANDGNLHSATDSDGEADLPYTISLDLSGSKGTGMDEKTEISTVDLASAVTILSKAGDAVSSATDRTYDILVNVPDATNSMEMAGTYTDVLTFTYTDL